MKVYVGSDHNGFHAKTQLVDFLRSHGYQVQDDGDKAPDSADDFPVFASKVAKDVLSSDGWGILICGSGQGMCMAANRFRGIRACLGYSETAVRAARNDDDSNVLCLPANELKTDELQQIARVWLETPFAAASRFVRRIKELDEL
jgi:ribose 5-phosphate isomerase B